MPGKIRQNGNINTSVGILVKVSGAWHAASSAFINVGGQWKQWFKASVLDSFNRTTSGNLGTADSGQAWNATQGTWFSNGAQAQSNDSASNYSIATIDTGSASNIQTVGATTNGTGAAQWVTDSGNWFGVATGQEVVNTLYYYTCGCSTCSACATSQTVGPVGAGCGCTGGGTSYYVCITDTICSYSATYGGGSYLYYVAYCYNHYGVCSTYTPCSYSCAYYYYYTQCTSSYTYTCGCSTCQGGSVSYPAFVYVYQSVANAITTVLRTAISAVAASLRVVTSGGNTITVTPYSDSLTTPIGSPITYTASSTQTATQFGILLSPSQYNQGSTLDNYQSQNN